MAKIILICGKICSGKTTYAQKLKVEINATGTNVILDFGFWTRIERQEVTKLFTDKGIEIEWHYIDVPQELWQKNLIKRNGKIANGQCKAYFIDDNIAKKFWCIFEEPAPEKIDVWYKNDWN